VRDLHDCPYTLFAAIRRAMFYLSFDELPKEERPPKRIWDDDEAIEEWFAAIERKRKRDMTTPQVDDPVQNELTKDFVG
jgi:hypothetical protein